MWEAVIFLRSPDYIASVHMAVHTVQTCQVCSPHTIWSHNLSKSVSLGNEEKFYDSRYLIKM